MKILFLTKYADLGASSRIRSYQYIPYLQQYDAQIEVSPLLDNNYLHALYSNKRIEKNYILKRFSKRIFLILKKRNFDLIHVDKELFPWVPLLDNYLLNYSKIPFTLDYDDAIFHRYDMSKNIFVKLFLAKKIAKLMSKARTVIVGNEYLAEYAKKAGAKNIEILPSVINLDNYCFIDNIPKNNCFTIGWIGTPATQKYLDIMIPVLKKLQELFPIKLVLIGANRHIPDINMEIIPWSEATENHQIRQFDVGIMPLNDTPWEYGKCGFKLIQYMACGIPVLASPVGVNQKIVQPGVNGYLASSEDEWLQHLKLLAEQSSLRVQLGNNGRNMVEREYCVQVTANKLHQIFQSAINRN